MTTKEIPTVTENKLSSETSELRGRLELLEKANVVRRRRTRTLLAAVVVVGAAWPMAAGALDPIPHVFTPGTPISADDMNENFEHLRVGAEAEGSLGATYCGRSAAETNGQIISGALTGWAAARDLCRTACGGSATAHMCSTSEIAVGLQMGTIPPSPGGWVSGGFWFRASNAVDIDDCLGWTSAATTNHAGNYYSFTGGGGPNNPFSLGCDTPARILCCD